MFEIGDKIVYPMHGAGVVEAIEEKEVLGSKRQYYIMRMPIGNMKVMVPLDNVNEVGLRSVIGRDDVDSVISILRQEDTEMSTNWNHRYRSNMEKIKTGNIFEVAEVVRNLVHRDKEKGLSTGERKMLENARQILISEIVLAQGKEENFVETLLEDALE